MHDFIIQTGTFADYRGLSVFHYRPGRPCAATSVLRAVHRARTVVGRFLQRGEEAQTIGVLVRSMPRLNCALRDLATHNRYRADGRLLSQREAAQGLNREVRTISRVIVAPPWRGMGVAAALVRHALAHPENDRLVFTEALAAMGRVSPFFQRAGMVRFERPVRSRPEHARLLDALADLGIEPPSLASRRELTERLALLDEAQRTMLEAELRRWHWAWGRTPKRTLAALTLDTLLREARDRVLFAPVYFVYRHARRAETAGRQAKTQFLEN